MPRYKKKVTRASKAKKLGRLARALRYGGSLAGGAAGGLLGYGTAGSSVGRNAGASLSKWLGAGDYSLKSNTLAAGSSVAAMHSENQTIRVTHKEYLGDVFSAITPGDFSRRSYNIQPGNRDTFPWLNLLATNFSEYEIKGMVFTFKSNSGDAFTSTDSSTGSVMMMTQYRANENNPDNKQEMLQAYWSNSAKPQENFVHAIECDPAENPFAIRYIRNSTDDIGNDVLFYDHGKFHIATVGFQGSNVNCGELWVSYDIELKKPRQRGLETPPMAYFHASSVGVGATISDPIPGDFNTVLATIANPFITTTSVTFPKGLAGRFLVIYALRGTPVAFARGPSFTADANINFVNGWINQGSSNFNTAGNDPKGEVFSHQLIDIIDPNLNAVLGCAGSPGALPSTPTAFDFYFIQVPDLDVSFQ